MTRRLSDRERLLRSVPEAEVERVVLDALRTLDYVWHTNGDSRRATAGLPDIVAVRNGVMVMLELKRETGRLRAEQQQWFAALLGHDIPKNWTGLVREWREDFRSVARVAWIAGVVRPRNLDDCIRWLTEAAD